MKTARFWPSMIASLALVAIIPSFTLAQPAPISACGTTISASGSYVVTRNLTATSNSSPCINVKAPFVTIDLGGFVLTGIGGSPGISSNSNFLTVTNGVIRAFHVGVNAPAPLIGAALSYVRVFSSQSSGAVLGDDAQVRDSGFSSNGTSGSGDGLDVRSNALVTRCAFISNKGNGLRANGGGVVVTNNRAASNRADGFLTHGGSVLRGNTAVGNASLGFQDQGGGCAFKSNVATGNGNSWFLAFNSALVGNNASGNKNEGFDDAGGNTFEGNTAFNNSFDGFAGGSGIPTTFVNNTSNTNLRNGFNLLCPDNFINETALQNETGASLKALPGTCHCVNFLASGGTLPTACP